MGGGGGRVGILENPETWLSASRSLPSQSSEGRKQVYTGGNICKKFFKVGPNRNF